MRKRIAIDAAITASLALWAAVSPQTTVDKEVPTPSQTTAVTAPQATPSEPTEPTPLLTTEMEEVDGTIVEPVLEEADEQPPDPAPEPTAENQAEPETGVGSSADMVYVPGFGWIESQGPNQVEYAEDMYENGKKIGIMD